MNRLLIKGSLFAALVLGPLVAIFLLPLPHTHDLSPILNKLDLLKDGRRDRIIFVGGSGLYCGLDSEEVQTRLGRPVINLGLYAGFGITALLREVKPHLREGDVVVVVPEYGIKFDSYDFQARRFLFTLGPARNFMTLYGGAPDPARTLISDMYSLVKSKFQAFPQALREAVRTRNTEAFIGEGYVFYRKYFNASGDSLRPLKPAASPEELVGRGAVFFAGPGSEYLNQSLAGFNDFCQAARAQGVRTYFVFPAYPEGEYRRQRDGMRRYEQRLREELSCPVLGKPGDFLYPYEMFTDTVHHLDPEGKRRRTKTLITLLEKQPAMVLRRGPRPTGGGPR